MGRIPTSFLAVESAGAPRWERTPADRQLNARIAQQFRRIHAPAFLGSWAILLAVWALGLGSAAGQTPGNCSEVDLDYICQYTELVQGVAAACGNQCLSEGEECMEACMAAQLELSSACIGCFGQQTTCVVQNCFFACAFLGEAACAECALTNCEAGFNACAGIVDQDEDEWTNLCDCNDSNPVVHPGAPGTGQGVDNNCNGLFSPAELAECTSDVNGDNIVGTEDLLSLLSVFGCTSGCPAPADFNDDGMVTAGDLLIFLSEFGMYCL